jgi:hypothetical protein
MMIFFFKKKKKLPPYATLYKAKLASPPPGANDLPQNNILKTNKALKIQFHVKIKY